MSMKRLLLTASVALALAACEPRQPEVPTPESSASPGIEPVPSLARLERGARLFQEHCAQCHGPEAQGHPDWETPGVVAAPPLNGTGKEWKRSRDELVRVVLQGAERDGVPVMPGWEGRLTEAEADDVIAWFQALWPAEVYARWKQAGAGAKP